MPQEIEFLIQKPDDWTLFWKNLAPKFSEKTLLLLDGEVGAGKTTSLGYLTRFLNVSHLSSPTFALHQRYEGEKHSLDHVDLYRMRSLDEIEDVGFWDLFSQTKALIAVEWAQQIPPEYWPLQFKIIRINIRVTGENQRRVIVQES